MLPCQDVYEAFQSAGVRYFTGVPDSLLKDFCAYIADHAAQAHIIAANEGSAVALAVGRYLATSELGMVYLQNSGIGNAVNPLISLADPEVYSIPLVLLIGWRGEPDTKDEPQHIKQGKITLSLLEAMEIPFDILPTELTAATKTVRKAVHTALERSGPFAIVVRIGTFEHYALKNVSANTYPLKREDAIQLLVDHIEPEAVVIGTTGKTSRELFEYRVALGQRVDRDFLTVGSMGHASQIALAIAIAQPHRPVYCFDGDGSVIMHMGALTTIGAQQPENFRHVIINNGAHDSVGGQPTAGFDIDLTSVGRACAYRYAVQVDSAGALRNQMKKIRGITGPLLLEIRTNRGARSDLGRPTSTPLQNLDAFTRTLRS